MAPASRWRDRRRLHRVPDPSGVRRPARVTYGQEFRRLRSGSGRRNGGTPHGTGVAEIVHDVAPGASLWLVKVGTDIGPRRGGRLPQAPGRRHHHDVPWLVQLTPGDWDGFFDQQVDEARAAGILWTTAAANSRRELLRRHLQRWRRRSLARFRWWLGVQRPRWRYRQTCAALNPGFVFSVYLSGTTGRRSARTSCPLYRLNDAGTAWVQIGSSTNDQAATSRPRPRKSSPGPAAWPLATRTPSTGTPAPLPIFGSTPRISSGPTSLTMPAACRTWRTRLRR